MSKKHKNKKYEKIKLRHIILFAFFVLSLAWLFGGGGVRTLQCSVFDPSAIICTKGGTRTLWKSPEDFEKMILNKNE